MNWYNIKNVAESNITEVMIYDEIGMYGVDAKSFIDDVKNIIDLKIYPKIHLFC